MQRLFTAAIAALALAGLAAATPALAATPRPLRYATTRVLTSVRIDELHRLHLHALDHAALESGNWAGWGVTRPNRTSGFRQVGGYFTVPSVNCARSPLGTLGEADASQWVGVDGMDLYPSFSPTVEQTGVDGVCDASGASYYSWYEMYPRPPVELVLTGTGNPYVRPGDRIFANVSYNAAGHDYQVTNDDLTQGVNFTTHARCGGSSCSNATVEAVSEVPGGGPPAIDLADYAMAHFDGLTVTNLHGRRGGLANSAWPSVDSITMVDPANQDMAAPSALYGPAAFHTTWHAGT